MSHKFYLKYTKETIKVAPKSFAGGGEGDLYKIVSPAAYRHYVAKIYHPQKQSLEREKKIQYLIKHPPEGLSERGSIVWIKDALYDTKNKFVGFIMPFVKGEKLEILCLGKLSRKIDKKWHRFDLRQAEARKLRLRICFNLAVAIYQMHATENYVIVDLKPDNVIIQPNGLLAIVDTDSVEVIEDGVAIYPAPVATPEYTPPEFYTNNYRKDSTVGEPWDRFGLAVIFYKLLFGIHPFTGSASAPYDHLVSLHEKIEAGLFVHSESKWQHLKVIPPPHKAFADIDPELQQLFIKCFEQGHFSPDMRPTANEWCSALLKAIGDPALEARFSHIAGVWGGKASKFKMPSSLYREHDMAMKPVLWVEEKVNTYFESPPVLPLALHEMIRTGKKEVKLSLRAIDYVMSWLIVAGGLASYSFLVPGSVDWVLGDFWLSPILWINLVLVAVLLLPQVIIPRIISLFRHVFSDQVRLHKLWKKFRVNYPQLKVDTAQVKQDMTQKILKENKTKIQIFEKNKESYVKPLSAYLKEQDKEVRQLVKDRKKAFAELNEKYLKKAHANVLLAEMKGRSILDLEKRLDRFYKLKMEELEKNIKYTQAYKAVYKEYNEALDVLKKEDEVVQQRLMNDAMVIFEMDHFYDKYLKGSLINRDYLKALFEEKRVDSLLDIEKMELTEEGQLYIYTYHKTPSQELRGLSWSTRFPITKELYPGIETLFEGYQKYADLLLMVKEKDLEYGTEYFQEVYAEEYEKYKEKKEALKSKVPSEEETAKKLVKEKGVIFAKQLEDAKTLLEELKELELNEVDALQVFYEEKYKVIIDSSEEEVNKTATVLDGMKENYKITINNILASPKMEKMKINFNRKVEKIKEDIIKLEKIEKG